MFPGLANTVGASAYRVIDTTKYANGLHTISWAATDNAGISEGIGSRYFTIQNGTASLQRDQTPLEAGGHDSIGTGSHDAIFVRLGYDETRAFEPLARGDDGAFLVRSDALDLLTIRLPGVTAGYTVADGQSRELPIGSTLDAAHGVFTWQPGPGFLGEYELVFAQSTERIVVRVRMAP